MIKLLKALIENKEGRTTSEDLAKAVEKLCEGSCTIVSYKGVFFINIDDDTAIERLNQELKFIQEESKATQYIKRLIRQKEFLLSEEKKDEVLGYLHENQIKHKMVEVAGREFIIISEEE